MRGFVPWLIIAVALSGCAAQEPQDAPVEAAESDGVVLAGIVQDDRFEPIAGASVSVLEMNFTETSGNDGRFAFPEIPIGVYTVVADAPGYVNLTIPVTPTFDGELLFQLELEVDPNEVFTDRFQGRLQCAAEYVIISGSCDRLSTEFGGPGIFTQTSQFQIGLGQDWQTVVVDVAFDAGNLQGFEALRVSTKAGDAADELGSYERYARHADGASFTFRIEPGMDYGEETGPVPADIDNLLFDVFAQGQGYGTVCVPEDSPERPGECFTGIGVGVDLEFELIVSTFYGTPAPVGYTLL